MTAMQRRERQQLIFQAIEAGKVSSQHDVVELLSKLGIRVTQATASRDLEELGAVRGKDREGRLRYLVPDRSGGLIDDLTFGMEEADRLLVLRTPPGAAQLIASRVDRARLVGVVGTIAGDDTIFVACSKSASLRRIKAELLGIAAGKMAMATAKKSNKSRGSSRK